MTEITVRPGPIAPAVQRFILHWGEMGDRWGVNRSVSQIHALLFVAERPMTAEDIADALAMARSNVSNSLRELLAWDLIRRVPVLGDRRDFYEAEANMLEMVRRIALGRKARELDPTLSVMRGCVADAAGDKSIQPSVKKRLAHMLEVMELVDSSFEQVMRLPSPMLLRLIRVGGSVVRFATRGGNVKKKQPS
jgi:DNA-binding transcriptional regulator GbsR (MarR family)